VRDLDQKDGAGLRGGEDLVELSADKNHVWEALRALYLVGQPGDLDDVQRFAHAVPGLPENIERQALLTVQAIQERKAAP